MHGKNTMATQNNNQNSNNGTKQLKPTRQSFNKPTIPTKPSHLKSLKKKAPDFDGCNDKSERKTVTRMASLDHATPKSWAPRHEHSNIVDDKELEVAPKSPFATAWRPAPHLKVNRGHVPCKTEPLSTIPDAKEENPTPKIKLKDLPYASDNTAGPSKSRDNTFVLPKPRVARPTEVNERKPRPTNLLKVNQDTKQTTGLQHRPSLLRDPKSPGFNKIRDLWKNKECGGIPSPIHSSPRPFEIPPTKRPITKTQSTTSLVATGSVVTWQPVHAPLSPMQADSSDGVRKHRAALITHQTPKPYRSASVTEEPSPHDEPHGTNPPIDVFKFENNLNKEIIEVDSSTGSGTSAAAHGACNPRIDRRIDRHVDVGVYEDSERGNVSSGESPERGIEGRVGVARYEDLDERDDTVVAAVYSFAEQVDHGGHGGHKEHRGHTGYTGRGGHGGHEGREEHTGRGGYTGYAGHEGHTGHGGHKEHRGHGGHEGHGATTDTRPGYLPMSVVHQPDDISYEQMDVDNQIEDIDYTNQVVPAPTIPKKSTREYHEIDPNGKVIVPPPPAREAPKPPSHLMPHADPTPPPLPPDNQVGRRSMMLSTQNKLRVVQELKEKVPPAATAGRKLNYIDVEVSPAGSPTPLHTRRTNYTDVVVSDDVHTSERNDSGDDSLDSKKTKDRKKKSFLPFSSKDSNSSKASKEEVLTDFEKERNKKKRISGRFLRKNKDKDKKTKKDRNSDGGMQSFESDSGYDIDGSVTTLSSETSRTSNITTSSSSAQSSGDGEVRTTHGDVPSAYGTNDAKWKVLPTSKEVVDRRRSSDITIARTERTYKKSLSHGNIESTVSVYPPHNGDSSNYEDSSTWGRPPVVPSFLHQTPPGITRSNKPPPITPNIPPVPPHDPPIPQYNPPLPPNNPPIPPHNPPIPPHNPQTDFSPPKLSRGNASRKTRRPRPLSPNLPPEAPPTPPDQPHPPLPKVLPPTPTPTEPSYPDPPIYSIAEGESDGEAPPPIPQRDALYEGVNVMDVVPPSPLGRSKLLETEPLYQIYRSRTLSHASTKRNAAQRARNQTVPSKEDTEWKSELLADDMATTTLWRTIPEVERSGYLDGMTKEQVKLQQAQFEVISSQASYLRSLNILVEHFMDDWSMQSSDVIKMVDRRRLFSNIEAVRSVEKRLLEDLEKHFWSSIKLSKVCEVIARYAKNDFSVYILYIQNQVFQDRVLTRLQRNSPEFVEQLERLEADERCNKLPLLSFLLLPMQRVTRLPLLISAIVKCSDDVDPEMLKMARHTLGVVNKLVKKCNEGARKMEQTEKLAEITSQLDYAPSIKTFALVSQSRSLVKKGEMNVIITSDSKKSTKSSKLMLFLFSDVLLVARKKSYMDFGSPPRYEVVDWAKRSYICVNEQAKAENEIYMVLLENQGGRRIEMVLVPPSQNELTRWTSALNPPSLSSTGESIYETWDCPQYYCVEPYIAQQPDELTIDVGDVMKVMKKTSDGWLEGERLRDGELGWFPLNRCDEIEDEHTRARNLKLSYQPKPL